VQFPAKCSQSREKHSFCVKGTYGHTCTSFDLYRRLERSVRALRSIRRDPVSPGAARVRRVEVDVLDHWASSDGRALDASKLEVTDKSTILRPS
jgi:hypothetical protein